MGEPADVEVDEWRGRAKKAEAEVERMRAVVEAAAALWKELSRYNPRSPGRVIDDMDLLASIAHEDLGDALGALNASSQTGRGDHG